MKKNKSAYWWCQIGGWSAYCLVYTFFYYTIRTKPQPYFFQILLTDAVTGILITHFMRMVIGYFNLLKLNVQRQIITLLLTSIIFAFLYSLLMLYVEDYVFHFIDNDSMKNPPFITKLIRTSFGSFFYMLIWNLIYFMYHYIQKSRQEQIDRIRLESLVKELELKTIKAHINPHFIFNALNSIRALVDENPIRARTAITELSNILRSSMQAEKAETSPLEKELNIVKDYLALEHIRFEDRLQVEYDIDEDTLDQQVPPMMLQTLVENAIKHGISKQKNGGLIKVISDFRNNHHELIIQNTGHLDNIINGDGFGIASTQNRLSILFGDKASFELKDLNENMVEAKVIMPVTI